MNLQHDRIAELCEQMKFARVATEWPAIAQQAAESEASFADFLERVLVAEYDARLETRRQTMLKLATLPAIKTLEQYDFGFASGAPRAQIQELAARGLSGAPRTSCCLDLRAWARATSRSRWRTGR